MIRGIRTAEVCNKFKRSVQLISPVSPAQSADEVWAARQRGPALKEGDLRNHLKKSGGTVK
jgi:hypothetical protein